MTTRRNAHPSVVAELTLSRALAVCCFFLIHIQRIDVITLFIFIIVVAMPINVLRLRGVPILRQLQLEEALFRSTAWKKEHWCLLNENAGSLVESDGDGDVDGRTVVLGISGKMDKLVHERKARTDGVGIMRRFSGGGTVVIDKNVLLVSVIASKVNGVSPYPRPIMAWTEEELYQPVMNRTCDARTAGEFAHRENDYVFGDVKVGGNAQAISRDRWLHHTSFLWDVCPVSMSYLKMPEKVPEYRAQREHTSFVDGLKNRVNVTSDAWLDAVEGRVGELFGGVVHKTWDEASAALGEEHRQSVKVL